MPNNKQRISPRIIQDPAYSQQLSATDKAILGLYFLQVRGDDDVHSLIATVAKLIDQFEDQTALKEQVNKTLGEAHRLSEERQDKKELPPYLG